MDLRVLVWERGVSQNQHRIKILSWEPQVCLIPVQSPRDLTRSHKYSQTDRGPRSWVRRKLYDITYTHVYRSLRLEIDHKSWTTSRCVCLSRRHKSQWRATLCFEKSKNSLILPKIFPRTQSSSLLPSRDHNFGRLTLHMGLVLICQFCVFLTVPFT